MLDDIAEGFVHTLGRVVGRFIVETIFETVCFFIGKPVVRVFTLGRYPEVVPSDTQQQLTSAAGLLTLLAIPLAISVGWFR
jgi:hypothetical protein